uniref:Ig-like domain-containing protein n=1 Tax=Astatotilapia calliptera TaxID=8154 RepID=A0A3P8NKQ8_ASTCA
SVKMVVLWMILLLLHHGSKYSLVPVKMVQLGEPATLKCDIPMEIRSKVYWYRQSVGDTLKLIVTLYRDTEPVYASPFLKSRFSAKNANNFSKLTILETIQEDEGIYHCGTTTWHNLEWSGTYLLVKGNTERTSNYIVVQQPIESNPLHPGDTATLQCSVLSDSQNKTCPGVNNVFWFRAGSNKSHPNIIYTDGNRTDQCEKRSDHQKRCVYQLSKNVSSSDAGTYYCAVATCGEILLGNGTTVELGMILFYLLPFILNYSKPTICSNHSSSQSKLCLCVLIITQTEADINYAALNFSERKTRGRRKREFTETSVYS